MTEPWNTPKSTGDQSTGEAAKQQANAVADTAKDQAGNVKDAAVNQASTVKDAAVGQASDVKDHAAEQAQTVKDTAVEAGQQVADTARLEAGQVVGEARDQIRGLVDTTTDELRSRAMDGQVALTSTLESLTQELSAITRGERTSGPVNQFVQELSARGETLTGWLQNNDPEDVLVEVRRYAARRPVAFLAIAAGAGMLAGRIVRGTRDLAADEKERAERMERRRQLRTEYQARVNRPATYPANQFGDVQRATPYPAAGYQGEYRPAQPGVPQTPRVVGTETVADRANVTPDTTVAGQRADQQGLVGEAWVRTEPAVDPRRGTQGGQR